MAKRPFTNTQKRTGEIVCTFVYYQIFDANEFVELHVFSSLGEKGKLIVFLTNIRLFY